MQIKNILFYSLLVGFLYFICSFYILSPIIAIPFYGDEYIVSYLSFVYLGLVLLAILIVFCTLFIISKIKK